MSSRNTPTVIYLVRHGQSVANVDPTAYKRGDHTVPLTPLGRQQVEGAGRKIASSLGTVGLEKVRPVVWTSPDRRCRETGAIVASSVNAPVRESILIREQEFGIMDGLGDDECASRYPDWIERQRMLTAAMGKFYFRYPGGESRADVAQRVHQFFGTLHRDDFDPAIVVCHGVAIRAFLMMWLHVPVEWFESEPNPDNASVRLIVRGEDRGYIV